MTPLRFNQLADAAREAGIDVLAIESDHPMSARIQVPADFNDDNALDELESEPDIMSVLQSPGEILVRFATRR